MAGVIIAVALIPGPVLPASLQRRADPVLQVFPFFTIRHDKQGIPGRGTPRPVGG